MLGACDITAEDIQNDVQFQIVETNVLRKMQQNKELTPLLLFHDGQVSCWVERMKIKSTRSSSYNIFGAERLCQSVTPRHCSAQIR
jgi:hypothetical protein